MTRKKVLHLSKFYPPYAGGIEEVCRLLIEGMGDFEQRVLCFNTQNATLTEEIKGIEVTRAATLFTLASQNFSFALYREFKRLLTSYQPDIVHLHCPNPLAYLYVLRLLPRHTKLVVHWHSDIVAQRLLYPLVRPWEQAMLRRANAIIATSPNYLEGSKALKNHRHKCHIVPCPVDTDLLIMDAHTKERAVAIKQQYPLPIIYFMGRHVPYKGIEYLLQAARLLHTPAHVLIAGTGPLTETLKEQARDCSNVHFLGRVPHEDVLPHFLAADVFAFPSITRNEAFGVALAEAMYTGTPPVSFTIAASGVNWVSLNGQTGIEVPNQDVQAYAAALDHLLTHPEERQRLGQQAQQRVEQHFAKDIICQNMSQLYHSLFP